MAYSGGRADQAEEPGLWMGSEDIHYDYQGQGTRDATAKRTPLGSVTGNNGGLDVTGAVQHMAQDVLQFGERRLAGYVVGGLNLLLSDQFEGATDRVRGVMERRLEGDLGIVKPVGVNLHFGACWAPTEKVHGAAFAGHVDSPLPSLRSAHRFNDHIDPTAAGGQSTNRVHGIHSIVDLHNLFRPEFSGCRDLLVALDDGDGIAPDGLGDLQEHQTDGAAADHSNVVADLDPGLLQATQHTRQRLGHGSRFKAHPLRDGEHVQLDDAFGDLDVFGVSTVVEQQVFAKIFLMLGAIEAGLAGR